MEEPSMYDKMLARGVPMGWYKGKHAKNKGIEKLTDDRRVEPININIIENIFDGAQTLLTCNRCNQLYDKAKKDQHSCFGKDT